ncbi:hypothetical protein CICLE_v10004075mg [Citrus x clementina]|uniref:Uncharacterized protein n=1 Tax=Citrus clementina TaxID=85681 RepID=V4SAZ5_CITCL|nr:hypothetical protein CICLE_v10004075mg [Citrus x clementina]
MKMILRNKVHMLVLHPAFRLALSLILITQTLFSVPKALYMLIDEFVSNVSVVYFRRLTIDFCFMFRA